MWLPRRMIWWVPKRVLAFRVILMVVRSNLVVMVIGGIRLIGGLIVLFRLGRIPANIRLTLFMSRVVIVRSIRCSLMLGRVAFGILVLLIILRVVKCLGRCRSLGLLLLLAWRIDVTWPCSTKWEVGVFCCSFVLLFLELKCVLFCVVDSDNFHGWHHGKVWSWEDS